MSLYIGSLNKNEERKLNGLRKENSIEIFGPVGDKKQEIGR